MKSILAGLLPLVVVGMTACAPMNSKPAPLGGAANRANCGGGNPGATLDDGSPVQFSPKLHGYFYGNFENAGADGPGPKHGENRYVIRVVGANLNPGSADTKAALTYAHLSIAGKVTGDPYPADVVRQDDGSYVANLVLKKKGGWQIHVQLTDASGQQDDHTFVYSF